ncbi:Sulfite exporter TauE/SafE family protein [Seminavis robusta]|uniref:Sulfite exporter TauE/SafE family protein n=2 Tax=Seminavis robusta TaxID=568900 RepID=A0A9N8DYB6_9STRA|nr:Sulfite exporter TauE/SafE family protein [Seminavis robusta]|eukprot:Sro461_g147780.1 Sulfite exporter TauE/SafE family protein (735) ;mRNA; r:34676-36880
MVDPSSSTASAAVSTARATSVDTDTDTHQQPRTVFKRPRQSTKRTGIALSALSTVLVLALLVVVAVENQAPQSKLAIWLRQTPCSRSRSKSRPASQHLNQTVSAIKKKKQRRKRRLEEGEEEEDQMEEEEEENERDDEEEDNNDEDNKDNNQEGGDDLYNDDNGGRNQDDYYAVADDQVEEEEEEEIMQTYPPVYIDDDFYAFQEDPGPPRLFPLSSRDVAAYVLASCGLTLGASGGIGGGGIVVPVYILVAGLAPKIAIPLGAVTVLGGSVASTTVNARRRHPLADRPIIDWDLVLVTEPLTLIGALMGTLLHRILSEKVLIVILVLLLSVSAHSTLAKAKRMHDAETRYIQKLRAVHHLSEVHHHVHVPPPPSRPRIVPLPTVAKSSRDLTMAGEPYFSPRSPSLSPTAGVVTPPTFAHAVRTDDDCFSNMTCENHDVTTIDPDTSFEDDDLKLQKTQSEGSTPRKMGVEERQQILILNPDFITLRSGLLEEEKFTPRSKIIALCLMFSILMFLNIMIGGGAFPSPWGIRCGSVAFWVVQVIMVAFLVSSAWAAQTYLVNRHEMKEIVRFDYVHGDIKWDARSAIIYPALFICAGTFAGLFGIGGGMVTVPLMLAMGVHPAVVSATSSAMILFTSFASASSYLVFGLILYDYAIVCFVVGFFASLFGNKVMRQARQAKSANGRNFERNSYIAFCIGGVILVSSLLMTIDYVFRVYAFDDVDYPEGLCEGYRI